MGEGCFGLSDQQTADRSATAVNDRIGRLEREANALRTEVDRLRQREDKRRERVEQVRREREARVASPPLPPPALTDDELALISGRSQTISDPAEMYLDLLKNCLTRMSFGEPTFIQPRSGTAQHFDAQRRAVGSDRPSEAETMVGLLRLDNVQQCVVDVLRSGVPGDLVETGVWRGGVTILMRAVLRAYDDRDRNVWVADSFAGLPVPNVDAYPADAGFDLSTAAGFNELAVSVDQVKANFARYGLLDDRVRFLVGWFKDTLPSAPIDPIAVLRLDGDLYESTMDALNALYAKLSVGGYLIVDDYHSWEPCRLAIDEFRAKHGITDEIRDIDWTGVYWRRER